jgi:hypothetical protein
MQKNILYLVFWLLSAAVMAQPVAYYHAENMTSPSDVLRFDDKIWLATHQGISYFEMDGSTYQTLFPNLQANCFASHNDILWVGANNSLGHYDGTQWNFISSNLPLPFVNITQIAFDQDGLMWLVISGALFTYENGQFVNQNQQAELLRIKGNDIYITTAATTEIGKVRKAGQWENLPQAASTFANNPHDLQIDDAGVVWLSRSLLGYIENDSAIFIQSSPIGSRIGVYQDFVVSHRRNDIQLIDKSLQTIRLPSLLNLGQNGVVKMFYKQGQFFGLVNITGLKFFLIEWFPEVALDTANTNQEIRFNDFRLGLGSLGSLGSGVETYFQQPDSNFIQPILSQIPWISAIQDNEIRASSEFRFRSDNIVYSTGPISTRYDSSYVAKYSRVWKVSREEIERHKRRYSRNFYQAPHGIARWPGNGNVQNGEAPIIAPFFDRNGNGIYEPHLGDYPEILGDEMIYAIVNDHRAQRNEENNRSLGAEIHVMLFKFDEATHPDLANSMFCRYAIFNRSSSDWDSTAFTAFGDVGTGHSNFLFGSDSIEEYFFHQSDPANTNDVFTMTGGFLNQTMSGMMYSAPVQFWLPLTPPQITWVFNVGHNYVPFGHQLGIFSVVTPPDVYKGTGSYSPFAPNPPDTIILTTWAFNRARNWVFPLVESFEDRHIQRYSNTYLGTVPAGESVCVDMVFNFSTSITPDLSFDVVDDLVNNLQDARAFYQDEDFSCLHQVLSVEDFEANLGDFKLFPNPIQRGNSIILQDYIDREFEVQIFTSTGQSIKPETTRIGLETHIEISSNLSPGIYFLRLQDASGGEGLVRKILVVE